MFVFQTLGRWCHIFSRPSSHTTSNHDLPYRELYTDKERVVQIRKEENVKERRTRKWKKNEDEGEKSERGKRKEQRTYS